MRGTSKRPGDLGGDLSVSIVTYRPDLDSLGNTIDSLRDAVTRARSVGVVGRCELYIVDNTEDSGSLEALGWWLNERKKGFDKVELVGGQGNVGFGRGHNIALERVVSEFHLILNPDVVLEPDSVSTGVSYLADNPRTVLVSPRAVWPDGKRQYLCKRYPSVLDLCLRAWAPVAIKNAFNKRLARYELREETDRDVPAEVPIASGCFMLARSALLKEVGGFDPRFFMYFEDFDLSLRCGKLGPLIYLPDMRIVHEGGHAARKGIWHVGQFAKSAWLFFKKHGWRWW